MLLSIALFFYCGAFGQSFSKREASTITSVHLGVVNQDYGYQIISIGYDSIDGELYHPMFVNGYDFSGELLYQKKYFSNSKDWNPNFDINARLNDTTIVVGAIEHRADTDTIYNTIFWLNNDGDSIMTRSYHSPYHADGNSDTYHFVPTCIACSPDGEFIYLVSQVIDYPPVQNTFIIRKLTAEGDIVWTYANPIDEWYFSCNTIQYFQNQLWFISEASGQQDHYNRIKRLNDDCGLVDYVIEHNGAVFSLGGAADLQIDEDGITTTTAGGTINNIIPYTFKIDFVGDYLWYQKPTDANAPEQQSHHLARAPDGGFVSCSIKHEEEPMPDHPNDPSYNNTNEKIWLWKVDSDGVFQWQRFYEYLSFDSVGLWHLNSLAHDFKATPDGGFIVAGETTASCSDYPACDNFTQQGWLLKVDGCGCLVPGCDESCTVGVEESANSEERKGWFKVGPNPARDFINVYFLKATLITLQHSTLNIFDMQGNLIKAFNIKNIDTTYMIDTTGLAVGEYIVAMIREGMVLQTERVVVFH